MDPLTALSIGSTIAGGLGTLFGSQDRPQQIHPEILRLMRMMEYDYRNPSGINNVLLQQMRQKLKQTLGSEAGALGAMNTARINRQGGGAAAINASLGRVNSQRLGALGSGMVDIDIGNENIKQQQSQNALRALLGFTPNLGMEQQGQGFSQLFSMGLLGLLQNKDLFNNQLYNSDYEKYRPRFNPNRGR